jgi:hypothetical protein
MQKGSNFQLNETAVFTFKVFTKVIFYITSIKCNNFRIDGDGEISDDVLTP